MQLFRPIADLNFRILQPELTRCYLSFSSADVVGIIQNLTVQVAQPHMIMVNNTEGSNPCCCQILEYRAAKPASANDQYAGSLQLLLA
ncbi:hypothetical protein D3C72_2315220 [compost metagenome]